MRLSRGLLFSTSFHNPSKPHHRDVILPCSPRDAPLSPGTFCLVLPSAALASPLSPSASQVPSENRYSCLSQTPLRKMVECYDTPRSIARMRFHLYVIYFQWRTSIHSGRNL